MINQDQNIGIIYFLQSGKYTKVYCFDYQQTIPSSILIDSSKDNVTSSRLDCFEDSQQQMVFLGDKYNCYDKFRSCQNDNKCVQCRWGYCKQQKEDNTVCKDMNVLDQCIGYDQNNKCVINEQATISSSFSCWTQSNNTCIETICQNNAGCSSFCKYIPAFQYIVGKLTNSVCYSKTDLFIPYEIKGCIGTYCKLIQSEIPLSNACISMNDLVNQYSIIGFDQYQLCIQMNSNNNQAKKCRFNYCIIIAGEQISCVLLDHFISTQAAKQADTHYCQSLDQQDNNSMNCSPTLCLDKDTRNCVPLKDNDGYRGRQVVTDFCMDKVDDPNDYGLIECVDDYCISKNECVSFLSDQNIIGKNSAQMCVFSQNLYVQNCQPNPLNLQMISCNYQSLEICLNNNYCYFLNGLINTNRLARADGTCSLTFIFNMYGSDNKGSCIFQGQILAQKCSNGYCINQNACIQFDGNYIGRDKNYNCLQQNQDGVAVQCQIGYCLKRSTQNKNIFCVKIDIINDVAGVQINSQNCILTQDASKIQASDCSVGFYCLNSQGFCQILQSSGCSGINQQCVDMKSRPFDCYACQPDSCLLYGPPGLCIQISIQNSLCQSFTGRCEYSLSRNCNYCPDLTCKDPITKRCTPMTSMKLKSNQCLVLERSDIPCKIQDMNDYLQKKLLDNQYQIQCADSYSRCAKIVNSFCSSCPVSYIQPGNGICYSLLQQQQLVQSGNIIFLDQLNLQYINQSVGVQDQLKCPSNCFSCFSQKICTKCLFGYSLLEISKREIICISTDANKMIQLSSDYDENLIYLTNNLFYQCTQTGLYYGQKVLPKSLVYDFPLSQQQVEQYDQIQYRIQYDQKGIINCQQLIQYEINTSGVHITTEYIPQKGFFLQFSQQNVQISKQITYRENNSCQSSCTSCFFNQANNQNVCMKCNAGYTLRYDGICVKCPQNCLKCIFGGFYAGNSVVWSDIQNIYTNDFMSKLTSEEYTLKCTICAQGFTVNQVYDTCVSCGYQCINCYTGFPNYNHNAALNFDQKFFKNVNLVYKCLECINSSYKFKNDDVNCEAKVIPYCSVEFNQIIVPGSIPYILSIGSWGLNRQSRPYCYLCNNQFYNILNYSCLQSKSVCYTYYLNYRDFRDCLSSKLNLFQSEINQILFNCVQPIFDQNSKFLNCVQCKQTQCNYDQNYKVSFDNTNVSTCSQNINKCETCYSYNDSTVFQCTQCKQNYIISLEGCIQCPEGCLDCYLSDGTINQTDQLQYILPFYSLQDRKKFVLNNIFKFHCTSCSQNYYLNSQSNLCTLKNCDVSCLTCEVYQNTRLACTQCNNNYLLYQIQDIIGYISLFHNQNDYLDINLMINLNSQHAACHLCPYSCQVCEKGGDISVNPYLIYKSKCKVCKPNLTIPQIIPQGEQKNYEWRFDSYRERCVLCNKLDQGCTYELKVRQIYAICGNIRDSIGSGTIQDPLNIQRSSEINWNQLIINQSDIAKYYIFYNEMSVEFMDIQIILLGNMCQISQQISIQQSILNFILTLNRFSLTIMNYQTNELTLISKYPIVIQGFTEVNFLNIELQTQKYNSNEYQFGFQINNSITNKVSFTNVKFTNQFAADNNFIFQINNLSGFLNLSNVIIKGFQIQNNDFFTLIFNSDIQLRQRLLFIISNSTLTNTNFKKASLVKLLAGNLYIEFDNFIIQESQFLNSSLFLNIQSYYSNTSAYLQWNNININNCDIQSKSQIFSYNFFEMNQINNITFLNNNLTSLQDESSLFQQNKLWLSLIDIINNKFQNYNLFEHYSQPNTIYNAIFNYYLSGIYFKNNTISTNQGLLFKLKGNLQIPADSIKINIFTVEIDNIFSDLSRNSFIEVTSALQFVFTKFKIVNTYLSSVFILNSIQSVQVIDGTVTGIQTFLVDQFQIINTMNQLKILKVLVQNTLTTATIFTVINTSQHKLSLQLNIQNLEAYQNQFVVSQKTNNVGLFIIQNRVRAEISIVNCILRENQQYSLVSTMVQYLQTSPGFNIFSYGSLKIIGGDFIDNQTELTKPVFYIVCQVVQVLNSQFQTLGNQKTNYNLKGGFMYLQADQISIVNSSFTGQQAINGGAIYACITNQGQLLIRNSQFDSNSAYIDNIYSMGGTVYIQTNLANYLDISIENSLFFNNFAIQGAIFYIEKTNAKTFIKFNLVKFENNFSILQSIILYFDGFQDQVINVEFQDCQIQNTIQNMQDKIQQMLSCLNSNNAQIQQYYYIYISNATLITITNFQFQQTAQLIDLYSDQQNLIELNLPVVVYVFNTLSYVDSFSEYQQTITNDEIIHIEANSIALYSVKFLQLQSFQLNTQIIKLFAKTINLNSILVDNLICKNCSNGNINIEVGNEAYISNSLFQNNICQNGGGIYIQSPINQNQIQVNKRSLESSKSPIKTVQLFDNSFKNNTSQKNGGGIYLLNIYAIIINSTLSNNTSHESGGGIYNIIQEQLLDNDPILFNLYQLTNILLQNSYIVYNKAQNGGGYYSSFNLPQIDNSFILANNAQIFGSDLSGFPIFYQVYYDNVFIKQNQTIYLFSGKINTPFIVYLMNDIKQIYKNNISKDILLEIRTVQVQSNEKNNLILMDQVINFNNNVFDLSGLSVYGKFSQKSKILLSCNKVKQAIYQKGDIISIKQNITFEMEFSIVSECPIGYRSSKINNTYDTCIPCLDKTYNLKPGQAECKKCQSSLYKCQKNNIQIPDGYFRRDNNTDQISECSNWPSNCVGDISRDNSPINNLRNTNWNIYYCVEGNVGFFCEDCDYEGAYWGEKYMRFQQYGCQKCNRENILQTIMIGIIIQSLIAILICWIIFITWINYSNIGYQLSKKNFITEFINFRNKLSQIEEQKRIISVKILFCYLQILFMLTQLELQLPWPFTFILICLTRQNEYIFRSFDCLINVIPVSYARVATSIIHLIAISFFTVAFTFLFFYFYSKMKRRNYMYKFILKYKIELMTYISSLNFIVYSPSIIQIIAANMNCATYDGARYVSYSTSLMCDSQHYKWTLCLFLPAFFIIALIIPFLIAIVIKKYFYTQFVVFAFSQFTHGYKISHAYFWDMFRQIQIFFVILILSFDFQNSTIKITFLISVSLSQKLINFTQNPFNSQNIENLCTIQMDTSVITITLVIFLNQAIQSQNFIEQIICGVAIALINLNLFIRILFNILSKDQLNKILFLSKKKQKAIQKSQLQWGILRQHFKNKAIHQLSLYLKQSNQVTIKRLYLMSQKQYNTLKIFKYN
ncbi:transmembrane protein, putative (macronuclear) [Tetrahymena thermophila SB210]|uniref:Transmembrane protein, putative n=1 Tax=Tetrahymena thermophila (strain SB210) TaxID=312017 RepID=Q239U5_TETTS|nr:transmembrane protein, putative [Tetrahymena thermophila SB210]EAR93313.2 transmembrane protein, putative [Tetrahymena thermophila SB210]|eukprot:XP_001013558.2 transmembrane protein, putative [Tetrahymena thermophila SB210]